LAAQSIRKIKQVFGRLYAYGSENELIAAKLNPVRACNIRGIGAKRKSKAIVVPLEIAWKIAMDLPIMRRTQVPRFIRYGLIDSAYWGRAGLHVFRHSLATVVITEQQVDPKTAQGILRHASSDITMDISRMHKTTQSGRL
jgi:integrase